MKFIHLSDLHLVGPGLPLHGLDPQDRLRRCVARIRAFHMDAAFVAGRPATAHGPGSTHVRGTPASSDGRVLARNTFLRGEGNEHQIALDFVTQDVAPVSFEAPGYGVVLISPEAVVAHLDELPLGRSD